MVAVTINFLAARDILLHVGISSYATVPGGASFRQLIHFRIPWQRRMGIMFLLHQAVTNE